MLIGTGRSKRQRGRFIIRDADRFGGLEAEIGDPFFDQPTRMRAFDRNALRIAVKAQFWLMALKRTKKCVDETLCR